MGLLNYTTSIDVTKTLGEIQGMLARAGASRITLDYSGQVPAAIEFEIATAIGVQAFRLPVNLQAIRSTLVNQHNRGVRGVTARHTTQEHAARVAWRIIKDWLEVQVALIETGMVKLEQVMLPYLLVPATGQTMFEAFEQHNLALMAPRSEGR